MTELTATMILCQMTLGELLPTAAVDESNNSVDDSDDEQDSGSESGGDGIVGCLSLSEYNLKKSSSTDRM